METFSKTGLSTIRVERIDTDIGGDVDAFEDIGEGVEVGEREAERGGEERGEK